MTFQSPHFLDTFLDGVIIRKIKNGISPSLSALYRNSRKKTYISEIGDFPILTHCLQKANQHEIIYNRNQLLLGLNQSSELQKLSKREKVNLLDLLQEQQQNTSHSSNETALKRTTRKGEYTNG